MAREQLCVKRNQIAPGVTAATSGEMTFSPNAEELQTSPWSSSTLIILIAPVFRVPPWPSPAFRVPPWTAPSYQVLQASLSQGLRPEPVLPAARVQVLPARGVTAASAVCRLGRAFQAVLVFAERSFPVPWFWQAFPAGPVLPAAGVQVLPVLAVAAAAAVCRPDRAFQAVPVFAERSVPVP